MASSFFDKVIQESNERYLMRTSPALRTPYEQHTALPDTPIGQPDIPDSSQAIMDPLGPLEDHQRETHDNKTYSPTGAIQLLQYG